MAKKRKKLTSLECPVPFRMGDEGDAAVVRHVQPFVRIGRPRVGAVMPVHEVGMSIAGCSPEPECTVDMEPRTGALEDVGDLSRRVEGAGVHLPELRTDDRRPGGLGECRA